MKHPIELCEHLPAELPATVTLPPERVLSYQLKVELADTILVYRFVPGSSGWRYEGCDFLNKRE